MKATGATPGAERSLLRWRNAVFVIFWLSGFQFASWAARVPNVRDILAASTSEMGVLIFGLALGAVLGLLASSHVIVRLGATASILIFLSLLSIGLVMVGLFATIAPGFVVIFVALLVLGAGNAITDVAMNLSGAANERRIGRTLMPMFHAAFSLGTMMGAGFGALSEQLGVPIGVHLTGVGVVAILTTRITVRFLQPAEQVADDQRRPADDSMADPLADAPSAQGWRARLAVWKDPRVLVLGLIVLGMAFAEGTANDWLSLSMVDGYGTTNPVGAAIFGVFVTAMTLGRLLGGRVLDRFGRVLALRATSALALIGLVLVILGPNLAVAIVGVVLWGLGASLGFPVGMSAAADDPRTATANVAAVATIGYFAFLIGPPLIGLLGEQVSLLSAFWLVGVLIVIAGLCAPAARKPARRSR